jgi:hypothetical protein
LKRFRLVFLQRREGFGKASEWLSWPSIDRGLLACGRLAWGGDRSGTREGIYFLRSEVNGRIFLPFLDKINRGFGHGYSSSWLVEG